MPLRNQQPEAITTHGFVECTGLLPEALCARLADLSMDKAIGISNAFQQVGIHLPPAPALTLPYP